MCGIFFALVSKADTAAASATESNPISDVNFELLKKRGPNSFDIHSIDLNEHYTCYLAASVLSLRGVDVVRQPIHDELKKKYLLWNGEIFASDRISVNTHQNDGLALFEHLSNAQQEDEILEIMSSVRGPYAFLYLDQSKNCVYFGRDRIGRRSLLISQDGDSSLRLMLTSVRVFNENTSKRQFDFTELKANGIYKIDLNRRDLGIESIEWTPADADALTTQHKLIDNISLFNDSLDRIEHSAVEIEEIKVNFLNMLKQSVMRRVSPLPTLCRECYNKEITNKFHVGSTKCDHAKIGILFSGGLDSAVIAALVDQCIPETESIDLLNIAFEQQKGNKFMVPDRISGLECLKELNKNRKWNFVEINVTQDELRELRAKLIKNLIYPLDTVLDDSIGCAISNRVLFIS